MSVAQFAREEEVVISGISGRFPDCDSVIEFWEKLRSGEDLVTEDDKRWDMGLAGAPPRAGKLKDLGRFDAEFFNIPNAQAETLDPQSRILLELCYEAIFDAGVNPVSLRGTNTGVFVACCSNDATALWSRKNKLEGFENMSIFGCSPSLLANRISYIFDFTGPSVTIDSACASSMYAIDAAVKSLCARECDTAIVGGTQLLLNPLISAALHNLKATSLDGRCKTFDDRANGYVRSEGIVVIVLQRANAARRLYGTIVKVGTNADGYKPRAISFPSRILQARLLKKVASEAKVSINAMTYLELHGTGTKVGDPEEMNAVDEAYCKDRSTTLYIGSVKSNMGHAEAASGLCALVKVLLSMKYGEIPPNLHYNTPNSRVPALVNGRMKVVTSCQPLQGDFVGINSFGFGGSNAHMIMRRPDQDSPAEPSKPRLFPLVVGVSGRTLDAVDLLLNQVEKQPTNHGLVALLHEIHSTKTPGHLYRGYSVISSSELALRAVQKQSESLRPVWVIFSGFGGQWPRMGQDLLKIPTFYSAIQCCNNALTPFSLNIFDIINDASDDVMRNFKTGFVAYTAIQIGLFDVLDALGVKPDGIIGHSLGEIAAGYADGCLTREEAILAAYYRAEVVSRKELSGGAMASVNLSADAALAVARDVELACDNSLNNVTLSGKESVISELITSLHRQGIYAKRVETGNVAFHSKFIASAGPKLVEILKKTLQKPKRRSNKWISSSVDRTEWSSDLAQTCSAEYLAHNLISPVRFRDASKEIPANAVAIEVGPHGILQLALRSTLPKTATVLSLMTKKQSGVKSLAVSLGRLYNCGLQPKLSLLYPPVQFPVTSDTPVLSALVSWNHEKTWFVPRFEVTDKPHSNKVNIEISRDEDSWYKGHKIGGAVLVPATNYLVLVWKTFAALLKMPIDEVPVMFQDVQFHRRVVLHDHRNVELCIDLLLVSGKFEVTENGDMVAEGTISVAERSDEEIEIVTLSNQSQQGLYLPVLNKKDVYTELGLHGYQYTGPFQGVLEFSGRKGTIQATNNWSVLLDTMLQVALLCRTTSKRELCVPAKFCKVFIDPQKFISQNSTGDKVTVCVNQHLRTVSCQGIHMSGLQTSVIQCLPSKQPLLEYVRYIPYHGFTTSCLDQAIQISMQIIMENTKAVYRYNEKLKIADFTRDPEITKTVALVTEKMPAFGAEVTFIDDGSRDIEDLKEVSVNISTEASDCNIVLAKKINTLVLNAMKETGFVILLAESSCKVDCLRLLASFNLAESGVVHLLQKESPLQAYKEYKVINLRQEETFHWLEDLKTAVNNFNGDVLVIVEPTVLCSGIIGLVNCLRLETNGFKIRCFYIQDSKAPPFNTTDAFYSSQLSLGLAVNIFRAGQWCTLRHLELSGQLPANVPVNNAYVGTSGSGGLSSLKWFQGRDVNSVPLENSFVRVYCSAINFKDVMVASGKLPSNLKPAHIKQEDSMIGTEFSGLDPSGRRVMGLVPCNGIAHSVHTTHVMDVPEHWSMEEAVTVPVAYSTAYYSLIIRGHLKADESVLIHAGAGGVGLAAIAIALGMGCTVFTTVGSTEKRAILKQRFHQLTDQHIANSRSTSFEQHVLQQTNGRGVDVVLNSLAEDKLLASVRCLAENGRFLEIGRFDLAVDRPLGLGVFLKNTSFHGICLDNMLLPGNRDTVKQIFSLVLQGIDSGVVKPLPKTVFSLDQVQEAFRFMAAGKHIGKVVIRIRDEKTSSGQMQSVDPAVEAIPRFYAPQDSVFIVTGGLGGFGLELSDWLVSRGARCLVLTSRTGNCDGYKALCVRRWREAGVSVHISTSDLTSARATEHFLKEAASMGAVVGIFHLAVVLHDRMLDNQTKESFQAVWAVKTTIARNLDTVSRMVCPSLRYFVVFSSMTAGRGNPGQSNYGMANSATERIVETRRDSGYPALAIQWGPVGEVGLAADMNEALFSCGVRFQSIRSCLNTLETLLLNDQYPIVGSILVSKDIKNKQLEVDGGRNMLAVLATAFGVKDLRQIPSATLLTEVGMDSLIKVEVSNQLEIHKGIKLSSREMSMLTVGKLLEIIHGVDNHNSKDALIAKKCKQDSSVQLTLKEQDPQKHYCDSVTLTDNTAQLSVDESETQECSSEMITCVKQPPVRSSENETSACIDYKYRKIIMNLYENEKLAAQLARINFRSLPLMPEKTMISMESMVIDDDVLNPLFLVHPIEGSCKILEGVARFIEYPVYGFQFTSSAPRTTLRDLAAFYLQELRAMQHEGPYYIGGYSLGVVIASEMVLQLEKAGKTVHFLAMDGLACFCGPTLGGDVITTINDYFDQEILIQAVTQYQPTVDETELRNSLSSLPGWSEYLNHYLPLLSMTRDITAEQITNLLEMLECCRWRHQALAFHSWPPNTRIKASVLLISARNSFMRTVMGEDHGFNAICEKGVKLFSVEGDHSTFIAGIERRKAVARIINEHLMSQT